MRPFQEDDDARCAPYPVEVLVGVGGVGEYVQLQFLDVPQGGVPDGILALFGLVGDDPALVDLERSQL